MTPIRAKSSTGQRQSARPWVVAITMWLAMIIPAYAEPLTGTALVDALQQGGYVIVMRHPSSPFSTPDKAHADPGNTRLERQLDDKGRETARAMGAAFRKLHIPVKEIFSSPTFRAREAVRLAALGTPTTRAELDEGAQGMQAKADAARSSWLRETVAKRPQPRTNTLIVTHTPNLVGAFGQTAVGIEAGEALVFHPDGTPNPELVARIRIEEWPKLAASH
jgi:phosphohistidine phosphatase SixA